MNAEEKREPTEQVPWALIVRESNRQAESRVTIL